MAEQGSLDCLVVVGTGFMGASLAKAVKQAGLARHVIGVDPTSASAAASIGVIDQAASSIAELSNCAFKEIAVVVASPVNTYATVFEALAKFSAALKDGQSIVWVTDLGSTKEGVVKAASLLGPLSSRFVSSHPMAGSEKQGPADARADLFQSARILISQTADSSPQAISDVETFWMQLGATPSPLPIGEHDELLAAISHLPHVVAYSLAGMLAGSPLAGAAQALHGGGLRDTTRIAASSAELWADIFLDNRERLLEAWSEWALHVEVMHQALEKADRETLIELLQQASQWRKGFL